jgi:putative endonuclease
MAYCYILFSPSIDQYYIGFSSLKPELRLEKHINHYYGLKKNTAKAKDWAIFFYIKCNSVYQARRIEKHIKRMKSRVYIENLLKYPEISRSLLLKYK